MELVSIKELIGAGAHFGHKTSQWNPQMKPYIFGKRNHVLIIDIRETLKGIYTAYRYLTEIARRGGEVLFVGIKRQAQNVIEQEAQRCGMHYANIRWLGGTLTNFKTIHARLSKLLALEKQEIDGTLERYKKKERASFQREIRKLRKTLMGIRNMNRLPNALVVVDTKRSKNAIREANKLGITTIGLVDTDGNPTELDIAIPVNDDAIRVIQITISKLADAIIEGKKKPIQTQLAGVIIKKEAVIVAKETTRFRQKTERKPFAKTKSRQTTETTPVSKAGSSSGKTKK